MNANQDLSVALPTPHQQVFAVMAATALLVFIIILVRRRTIREEYSLLWLITGAAILVLTLWKGLLKFLVVVSGVGLASSILFLAGILFLLLINIHLSAIVSRQRTMIKNLSIHMAIMEGKIAKLSAGAPKTGDRGSSR
jgi:hypothetical protein